MFGANVVSEYVTVCPVTEPGEEVGRRIAVGQAVVDLHQDRPLIALQALDNPALPERAVQIEGTLQGMGDGPGKAGVIARAGNRHPAQMMAKVEPRSVDPLLRTIERVGPQHLCASRY